MPYIEHAKQDQGPARFILSTLTETAPLVILSLDLNLSDGTSILKRQPTVEATLGDIGLTDNQVLSLQTKMNAVAIQCVLHACFVARQPISRRQLVSMI